MPASFVAEIVTLKSPASVGVPEISPVDVSKVIPAGNNPLYDQTNGAVPLDLSLTE